MTCSKCRRVRATHQAGSSVLCGCCLALARPALPRSIRIQALRGVRLFKARVESTAYAPAERVALPSLWANSRDFFYQLWQILRDRTQTS